MKLKIPILPLLTALSVLPLAHAARADVLAVFSELSNAQPYVGEAFTFTLKVSVTPGSDLENESIHGLDRHPLAAGTLRRTGRVRGADNNEIVSYSGTFRATAPFASRVELTFAAQSVVQVRSGFFTQWTRRPVRMAARPFDFAALALPDTNRPENFSGAIGSFTLTSESVPRELHVNTLVTRTIRLRGAANNNFGTGLPEIPDLGPNFKMYGLKEISRSENPPEVVLQQLIHPLNTNAVEIASPIFSYFDPVAKTYRTLQPPPEKLTFLAKDETAKTPESQKIVFGNETQTAAKNTSQIHLPLPRRAEERMEITRPTPVRFAPSQRAAVLFELEPGATVTVAEHAEGWLRVVSRGRAGWIAE